MSKFLNVLVFGVLLVMVLSHFAFAQATTENLVITTYYPSPSGSYRDLTVGQNVSGDDYDYKLYILRNGTAGNPGTYDASPALRIYDYAADGPAALPAEGIVQITAPRIATGDPNAANAVILNVANDNGSILAVKGNARVGIGTTSPSGTLDVNGDIYASLPNIGGPNATYNNGTRRLGYDVAELFDTIEDVESGDVLIISEDLKLARCNKAYDTKVVGIVSEAPAIVFKGSQLHIAPKPFEFQSGKNPPVALAGRVLCKVTTDMGGPVEIGDLLVTSSKPGYAMKGDPKKIQIGTVLGKALELLEKGEGKITVLVTLQ